MAAVLIQIYRRLAKRAAHRGAITDAHIRRKIESDPALEDRFGPLLDLALRVRHQEQRQSSPKADV